MSKVIEAYEELEKNLSVHFEPGLLNFKFWMEKPVEMSRKNYRSTVKKLAEENDLTIGPVSPYKVTKIFRSQTLESSGKTALIIELLNYPFDDPEIPVRIKEFTIPRGYEKAKELADYLLKAFSIKT